MGRRPPRRQAHRRHRDAAKGADRLILATDPDREGEAISWHVLEVLTKSRAIKDAKVERVVFNAITRSAVTEAMKHPRDIDMELVEAYLARRALDYLVGFSLSPVLWRKLPGARSAGRVQSVALRLIVDREMEIEAFRTQEYWSVEADVSAGGDPFLARLVKHEGKRLAKFDLGEAGSAQAAKAAVEAASFTVALSRRSRRAARRRRRSPPRRCSRKPRASSASPPSRAMRAAQKLYEGVDIGGETVGLITYMRTDGVQSAPEALAEAREVIGNIYGAPYVPESARHYRVKAKNAQEAHEAIRPTSLARNPGSLRLEPDLGRLYELIWKRMIASQMEAARIERTTIDLESADGTTGLRATGQVVQFDGYLRVYEEGRDDPEANAAPGVEGDDRDFAGRLPAVAEGAAAKVLAARADQHFTEPPPRYSEASLVKKMEELGIGRPSTYASILTVLRDRTYVRMDKNRFVPEDKGRLVTAFLEQFFRRYVEYDFTAALEEKLDLVSAGELDWKALLRDFWRDFAAAIAEIGELRMGQVIEALNEALGPHIFPERADGTDPRACPTCGTGRLSLKTGKFGAFIGCSNYPECRYTRPIAQENVDEDGGASRRPRTGRRSGQRPHHLAQGRALWPLRRGAGREAQTRQPAQGLAAGGHGPRQGDPAAAPAARGGPPPRRRQDDPGRHRPLWPLRQSRRDLRQPADRRRGVRGRPQPRCRSAGREARRRPRRPRRRDRAGEGAGRSSYRWRTGARPLRPLRPLHQARRGQRQRAQGRGPSGADSGRSRGPAGGPRRQVRRGQEEAAGTQGGRGAEDQGQEEAGAEEGVVILRPPSPSGSGRSGWRRPRPA